MIEWVFTLLVLYLLYKLIFDFIVPVSKVSSQMRSKINEMNRQAPNQHRAQQKTQQKTSRPPAEDYIDFEEIK